MVCNKNLPDLKKKTTQWFAYAVQITFLKVLENENKCGLSFILFEWVSNGY